MIRRGILLTLMLFFFAIGPVITAQSASAVTYGHWLDEYKQEYMNNNWRGQMYRDIREKYDEIYDKHFNVGAEKIAILNSLI